MDLFDKIDQFEKLANELVELDNVDDTQSAETIEEYITNQLERRNSVKNRMKKLAALIKR